MREKSYHFRLVGAVAARIHIEKLHGRFFDADLLLALFRRVQDKRERTLVRWHSACAFLTALSSLNVTRDMNTGEIINIYFDTNSDGVTLRRRSSVYQSDEGKKSKSPNGVFRDLNERAVIAEIAFISNIAEPETILSALYCVEDMLANWSNTATHDIQVNASQALLRAHIAFNKNGSFIRDIMNQISKKKNLVRCCTTIAYWLLGMPTHYSVKCKSRHWND